MGSLKLIGGYEWDLERVQDRQRDRECTNYSVSLVVEIVGVMKAPDLGLNAQKSLCVRLKPLLAIRDCNSVRILIVCK